MSEHKHTPLPWDMGDLFVGKTDALPKRAIHHDGFIVGDVWSMCGAEMREANAEFITHACNCYYDLLAACEAAIASGQLPPNGPTIALVRAAVAKAKPAPPTNPNPQE